MSERTRTLLSWHLARVRPSCLTEAASHESPRAVFIDADHPDAPSVLEANRQGECLPVILLAVDRLRHSALGAVVEVLAKPVSTDDLDRVADRLFNDGPAPRTSGAGADEAIEDPGPDEGGEADRYAFPRIEDSHDDESAGELPPSDAPLPLPLMEPTPRPEGMVEEGPAARERRQARVDALFGREQAIDEARRGDSSDDTSAPSDALYYDPGAYLGARLEHELQLVHQDRRAATLAAPRDRQPAGGFTLAMAHMELYVLPGIDRIYASSTLRSTNTARLTFTELEPNAVTVTHYQGSSMPALQDRVRVRASSGYTIDGFIWLAALMSSQGRLAVGNDLHRRYRLRHWPNLTRLEPVPTGIEIAGCWSVRPASIDEVIARTGVHPRFVHAFFAAASALRSLVPAEDA